VEGIELNLLSIFTPTPTLGLGNPGATGLRFRACRQTAMEAAARLSEFDPH
jgi:hypothetical protein